MTKSKRGGPRRKVRPDDKRGGARPGSGPKRKWLKMRVGQAIDIDGVTHELERYDGRLGFWADDKFKQIDGPYNYD